MNSGYATFTPGITPVTPGIGYVAGSPSERCRSPVLPEPGELMLER